jgi:aryl-alcohol dehydrogenase-like predicted oxidoreductase
VAHAESSKESLRKGISPTPSQRCSPGASVETQNRYNLAERQHDEVVDYCAAEGIVFVPFFPLKGDGGRALEEIAERHRAAQTQVKLAWLLRRSPAMLPIPGTLSIAHLRENFGALEIDLGKAEFDALR